MPTYCRAYRLAELRRFPGFAEPDPSAGEDTVVYLWDDLRVVDSPLAAEPVRLWSDPSPEWREFCVRELGFAVPADLADGDPAEDGAAPSDVGPADGAGLDRVAGPAAGAE